jgi:acyl-CoA synthetase (AMP-forming)/AMP-acid ligase II
MSDDIDPYVAIQQHSYADVLREHRRSRPHMIAAIDGGHSFTFTELDQRVNRLVFSLRKRGIGRGDRLLWLGQNSFKVLELLLAAAKLGAMLCPANWRMSVNEVRRTIDDFDPKVVFCPRGGCGFSMTGRTSTASTISSMTVRTRIPTSSSRRIRRCSPSTPRLSPADPALRCCRTRPCCCRR